VSQPVRRVLIVDDEGFVRSALKRALRREPYDIEEAEEPRGALEILGQRSFDLILADHLMPGMTGLELLKVARDRWPDTVRIILTGHADMQTAIDAINQGEIYRFLTKPWDDLELKVTLFNAFARQDLERENRRLMAMVRSQQAVIERIEREHPGIAHVLRDEAGAIVVPDEQLRSVLGSAA
jgi:two-component system probable response regulator PhcQ